MALEVPELEGLREMPGVAAPVLQKQIRSAGLPRETRRKDHQSPLRWAVVVKWEGAPVDYWGVEEWGVQLEVEHN